MEALRANLDLRAVLALERIADALERGAVTPETPLRLAGGQPEGWSDLADTYFANRRQDGLTRQHLRDNERHIRGIAERFGWTLPTEADEDSCRLYLSELRGRGEDGRPSAAYFNNVRSYLHNWFDWLRRREHIADNPVAEIPERRRPKDCTRGLTPFQIRALIERTSQKGKRGEFRADIYLVTAWTGMRRGEIEALTVADCCLDDDPKVTIHDSKGSKLSGSGRAEHIPLVADEAIECLRRYCAYKQPGDRVFKHLPSPETVRVDMADAGIAPDRRGREATLRSLRNSLATMLAVAGVPPKAAQMILRHRDIRLTLETYVDASLVPAREGMGQLAQKIGGFLLTGGGNADSLCQRQETEGSAMFVQDSPAPAALEFGATGYRPVPQTPEAAGPADQPTELPRPDAKAHEGPRSERAEGHFSDDDDPATEFGRAFAAWQRERGRGC